MSERASEIFRQFLETLGLTEAVDPELAQTHQRFTTLLLEQFSGLNNVPPQLSTFAPPKAYENQSHDPIVIAAIPFQSMCVHHLLPFFGAIDVAYLPSDKMVGFGSIGRVVDHFAHQPQVQERLVNDIAEHLENLLQPKGLLIRCRARQLCMEYRGAHKTGTLYSYASRGVLQSGTLRQELLQQFIQSEKTL